MKVFQSRELIDAPKWAAAGGQALHLHRNGVGERSPAAFRNAIARGEQIAHLFDWNVRRLRACVASFGVHRVAVQHADTPRQHVDLCGRALRTAMKGVTPDPTTNPPVIGWAEALASLWLGATRRMPRRSFQVQGTDPPELKGWVGDIPHAGAGTSRP